MRTKSPLILTISMASKNSIQKYDYTRNIFQEISFVEKKTESSHKYLLHVHIHLLSLDFYLRVDINENCLYLSRVC